MSTVSSDFPHSVNCLRMEAMSEFNYEVALFCWKVKMFSPVRIHNDLESPVFIGGVRTQHSWKLHWKSDYSYPRYSNGHFHKVNVELVKPGYSEAQVKAHILVTFKKPSEHQRTPYFTSFSTLEVGKQNDTTAVLKSVDLHDVRQGYLVDGAVTVHCSILIQLEPKQTMISKIILPFLSSGNGLSDLAQSSLMKQDSIVPDIRALLDSGEFADVQLVTQTKTISAHKAILAARSPVFAAMFRANMLEAQNNSVNIPDFELQVVEAMLEFIYTGQPNKAVFTEFTTDLFRIADKYELLGLKAACEEFLFSTVKIENAAEVLMVACLHNASFLKTATMNFIVGNKKKVIETESFKKFAASNPDLLVELFSI